MNRSIVVRERDGPRAAAGRSVWLLAAMTLCLAASTAAASEFASAPDAQRMVAAHGAIDRIRSRGFFLWGGDEEGGGPYIYPDPADPGGRKGFEVDLAGMLARELGAELGGPIEPRFFQGQWDTLPDLLETGRIDLILNGYEWTQARARLMACTLPYYVYELQLLARADDRSIQGWDDLARGRRARVGVLGGSAAENYLNGRFGKGVVEPILYDGNTSAMGDVASGKIDATLQDLPIALFYGKNFPALRFVGDPVAPGRYVIFARKSDTDLVGALDRAILGLRRKGELRRLYESYGIWTAAQENAALLELPAEEPGSGGGGLRALLRGQGRTLVEAAGMTVLLSVVSMPIAIVIGIFVALGRLYGPRLASPILGAYVEILRGTPLMLQLFVIFFMLPRLGLVISALPAAILGLSINYSAYEAEIYRAGLLAVPGGQMEAALALGMSRALALRRIVVPQAVRIVIPPVTNDFIALFKDTSVCSVITVVELTKRYNIAAMSDPSQIVPLAALTALLYLAMSYPLSVLSARMERRLRR